MKALAVLTNAKKKMDKMLSDFNRALPVLKSLGLSVTNLQIDMGFLPAPCGHPDEADGDHRGVSYAAYQPTAARPPDLTRICCAS